MERQNIQIKEIRELAKRFTPEEIDNCITQQIEEGANECTLQGPTEKVLNELSKAEFVRKLVDSGASLIDATRELAKRIRAVQEGFGEK